MIAALIRAIGRQLLRAQIHHHECGIAQIARQRENDVAAERLIAADLAVLRRRLQIMVQEDVNLKTRTKIRRIAR